MNSSRQIKLGAILSYAVIFFNILIGLIYTPWMIRKIGASDYGLYILVTSFLAYFVVDFGMWQAINKLITQYRAEGDEPMVKKIISVSVKIYVGLDSIVCVVLTFVYLFIENIFINLSSDELMKFKSMFFIASLLSVLSFPLNFQKGIMMSYEYFIQAKLFEFSKKVGIIIITVILLACNFGVFSLVLAYGLIPLLVNLSETLFLYKKGIRFNFNFWDKSLAKSVFSLSIWLLLVVLAELLINNISPSLIATFSTTEQIAVFAIGLTIYGYVYTIAGAINGLFLPKVSVMRVKKQFRELSELTFKVGRMQLQIVGFVIMGIVLTGKLFIEAWVGSTFQQSYYILIFLVINGFFTFSQAIESTQLFAINKIKYRSFMMLLTALVSVVLSMLLIPKFGAIGSAIAICVSNFLFMVIGMNIVYYKVLNFDVFRFVVMMFKFMIYYFVIAALFLLVNKCFLSIFLHLSLWMQFFINALIYTIIYVLVMYVFVTNSYEKSVLFSLFKKQ